MFFPACVATAALSLIPLLPASQEATTEPALDRTRAQAFFDRLGAHVAKAENEEVAAMFDAQGLHDVLDDQTLLPREPKLEMEQFSQLLGGSFLPRLMAGLAWERCEVRNVRVKKDQMEAVVYAIHYRARGPAARILWWLNRVDGQWLVEDFQDVSRAMRWSTSVGLGLKMSDRADPLVQTIPDLMMALQRAENGEADSIEKLEELDDVEYPAVLESMRQLSIAKLYLERESYDRCLVAAESSLSFGESSPSIYLVCAQAHNGVGSHEQAQSFLEIYLSLLEPDAETDRVMGDSYRGLGEKELALAAYRAGLAKDPQSGFNVLGLARLAEDDQLDELRAGYGALKDRAGWFPRLAGRCVKEKDGRTLSRLVKLQKELGPDHEDLARFEQAQAELGG